MRTALALFAVLIVAGCTIAAHRQLDDLYGEPDPARYEHHTASPDAGAAW